LFFSTKTQSQALKAHNFVIGRISHGVLGEDLRGSLSLSLSLSPSLWFFCFSSSSTVQYK